MHFAFSDEVETVVLWHVEVAVHSDVYFKIGIGLNHGREEMFHVDDAGHGKWRGSIHGAWRWHTSIDVVDTGELLELAHEEVFHFLMRHKQTAHENAAIGFWNSETGNANFVCLSITDEDFRAVLALCEPLYLHATHILSFLDKSTELNSRGIADREMLYAALPQEFTKQMVMEQAEKLNIPVNTARSWIQRLREKGALDMVMVKGKGVYSKKQR